MTWKEFKDQVEAAGVLDTDEIFYIDTGNYPSCISTGFEKDEPPRVFSVTGR